MKQLKTYLSNSYGDPYSAIASIEKMLARHGAQEVVVGFQEGVPVAITFTVLIGEEPVCFRLENRWERLQSIVLQQRIKPNPKTQKC